MRPQESIYKDNFVEINEIKSNLETSLNYYNQILARSGRELYTLYQRNPHKAAVYFLNSMFLPHHTFIKVVQNAKLNTGSIAGFLEEWYFYYLIKSAIDKENISNIEVFNNYKIPFKWKGVKRHVTTNVDIAVVSKKPKRILYCLEIKTNFEDNFSKYYYEQNIIYHHRTKAYPDFKYHYITFSEPERIIKKLKRQVNTLSRRNELWVFPKEELSLDKKCGNEKLINKAEVLLRFLYMPFLKLST